MLAYYFNPNIHPYSEYLKRSEAAAGYCAAVGVEFQEGGYEIENYFSAVVDTPQKPERCHECYKLRLEETAKAAVEKGIEAISTTLLVSPYQNHDDIRSVGEAVALAHGLQFFYRDFRTFYRESVAVSREMGMYRQNYCGCVFSERERVLERKARSKEGGVEGQDEPKRRNGEPANRRTGESALRARPSLAMMGNIVIPAKAGIYGNKTQ